MTPNDYDHQMPTTASSSTSRTSLRPTMNSGLTVDEKLHRPSYKMQRGEEKCLEMWGGEGGL